MILESVEHGPLIWPTIEENGVIITKKYAELSAVENIQADCDMKATNIILQGLPADIYSLVNHHRVAKDLWERVQLLMQGEGHMARQCTQPKRPRNATWFKEKVMLAEAQEAGQILDEEQLAFLADSGIPADQAQAIIPHNAAFPIEDLDTYDFDCDDLSTAQAVLMANIFNYGSDVISKASLVNGCLKKLKFQLSQFDSVVKKSTTPNALTEGKATIDNAAQIPFTTTVALGMFKLDLEPLASNLVHNREIHINYLKHTQEQADILRGIVEQAKAKQPLDNALDFACKHAKRIQELLVYVRDTCLSAIKLSETKVIQIVLWYLDSGCSKHMTGNRSQLMNFVSKFLGIVRFWNDQIARIMGFLRKKDEAPVAIIKCIKNIQVRLKETVHHVRTDNETKFVNQTPREFYDNVDISHQTSIARTPQQNDVVKRRNWTLVEAAYNDLPNGVKTAFLNGELKEEVYVSQPEGFVDQDNPSHVYKLKKALYGLKQAPSAWYDMLSSFLISQQFSNGAVDPTLFTRHTGNDLLLAKPIEKHLQVVKRIFRYLNRTINMGLWYSKDTNMLLTAYADADHAGCQDTRRSTSECAQFLGDKLVSWSSKKQKSTAISSTEAKYIALSRCCAQILWMRSQLTYYGFKFNKVPLYYDNKSAVALCCNNVQHSKAKHIDVRYHFIKEIMSSITAQQTKLDLELVPKENRLDIRKCNGRILQDTVSFLRELGHTREINSLNDVVVDQMHQPWRTFAALINRPTMKESKAYKTFLGYATGAVPPKIARKFKKASPSKKDSNLVHVDEEPVIKGKRVKRSVKKSSTKPATGIVIGKPPVETKSKRKEEVDVTRSKGIDLLSKVALTKEA
nr:hypothetical protein [Tanacetum cinerariifolium]